MSSKKPQARGFTLLEIMIALAIVGIALTAIIHTVNYHATVLYENALTTRMYQHAKEKMSDLEKLPRSSSGGLPDDLLYENAVFPIENTDLIGLRTVVTGQGRRVVLNSLVIKKEGNRN